MEKQKLIVIGNGMVSLRFLECLYACQDNAYEITVIGAEPQPAYNRVLLSSALAGEIKNDEIELKNRQWYLERNIKLQTDMEVTSIQPESKTLSLSDGTVLSWDRLVIACGSQPILLPLPGANLKGVMTFRSLQDVSVMEHTAKYKRNAVVIGGGLLGLETAYGLNKLGMNVSLLHLMDRLMERQLDGKSAGMLKEIIEDQGIKIFLKANTACILGSDNVIAVQLKTGEVISADLVVMAVGIRPNISLAKACGLKTERGIIVNDQLETSQKDIYAIGECAQHQGIAYGLVEPLYEQASVLTKVLTNDQSCSYKGSAISTNLKVSGVEVFSAGEFEDSENLERIIYSDRAQGIYKKLLISRSQDGKEILAGVVLVGDRQDGPWYSDLIKKQTPIQDIRDTLIFGRDVTELAA